MPVYMIRAGENGPVKIGHSHDPEMRLGQLQISHWETLRLIRLFDGAEAEEAALHLRFADLQIRGEWHHFSRAMMGDVGLAEVPLPSDDAVDICEEVKAHMTNGMDLIRDQRGLMAKVALELGMTRAAIVKWDRIPAERLPEVERITGIPRHQLRPDICPPPVPAETEAA